jgi:hypothetical protein
MLEDLHAAAPVFFLDSRTLPNSSCATRSVTGASSFAQSTGFRELMGQLRH